MLDIIGRREEGRNQPHRANFQEGSTYFAASSHADVHFDTPAGSQDAYCSRNIIGNTQAEGRVILRTDGDDPEGGTGARQGPGHGRNGTITAADHKHTDPLAEGIPDHTGQVTALFHQVGFRHQLAGLHFMDHIDQLHGPGPGSPCTGIEY